WNLETLLILLADTSRDCARVVLPGEPTAMVLVEVTATVGNESCLITAPLSGPVLGDVSLRSLLPAKLLEDPSFQRPWLTSPFSLVRIELRGKEVGRFALDLRPSVTGFRLIIQRDPTPAGGTTIELEIEVIPGFVAGQAIEVMAVHLSSACADQSGPSIPVRFGTESIEREVVACSLDLKEPGEYRLELRRKGDRTPLRTLEVTARAPSIPLGHITLNAFLESWPSSEPVLANMVLLYRFLRTLPEPWCEFSLYTAIDRSRGALHNRRTLLYRLVDTLFGFLDDPPRNVMRVELVQPECVPMEILAEVGTVVLQLQFYTDEPLRVGLPKWEAVLTEACKDFDRSEEERAWLGILALAAGNLTGIARPMTSVLKRYTSAVVRPYFPCRDDFLNFLQGQTVPELISKGTK
ncbi:MAG: hypothetical protein NT069_24835, partial [Planctomycetota bacterium]|nr:hypothetical protein [Planctomycetota bacterium]